MIGFSVILALAAAAAAPVSGQNDPDAVVRCIRELVIGSLTNTRRVCHTVGEWRRIHSDANDEARRIIQPGTLNDKN